MIRVMLVDDEELVRTGLSTILGGAPGITVVASCGGTEAVEAAQECRPDVVLLDVRMPGADGLTVLRALRALPAPPHTALLTSFDVDEFVTEGIRLGASGFLLKSSSPDELVKAVRALRTGAGCLTPPMARRLVGPYDRQRTGAPAPGADLSMLTPRERSVLALVAEGRSNHEIGTELFLAAATVKEHLSSVFGKLKVGNRVQAAVVAVRSGLPGDGEGP
ncbi:response regulator [Streptomyces sp. NPDC090025]|uniref:response regulator n=1 Tax=Streptomyces sp. NPDC090025 TaxID=3365922 RepID=UPI003833967C